MQHDQLSLTLAEGRPSGRFIPLIIEAMFQEFINSEGLQHHKEAQEKFRQTGFQRFVGTYFPEVVPDRKAYRKLHEICRSLHLDRTPDSISARSSLRTAGETSLVLETGSPSWKEILSTAGKAAWSRAPVLISGESGVGKEILARYIHRRSPRAAGPFIPINCAALPENLLESELFGFMRGAFTEARETKPGLLTQADHGTLFLDEIAEMTTRLQVKLLRFLQDHSFIPLGSVRPVKVDVRVLAATNRDMEAALAGGGFRQDLYYRLNVFHFHVPPLRERPEDLPRLAEVFVAKYNDENDAHVSGLSPGALAKLQAHSWPGNIRELENVIHRAVVLARQGLIQPEHLPDEVKGPGPGAAGGPPSPQDRLADRITAILGGKNGAVSQQASLGRTVPMSLMADFFRLTKGRFFAPREFAEAISGHASQRRRDKLAGRILKTLHQGGFLEHNGRSAQASRYRLAGVGLAPENVDPGKDN